MEDLTFLEIVGVIALLYMCFSLTMIIRLLKEVYKCRKDCDCPYKNKNENKENKEGEN